MIPIMDIFGIGDAIADFVRNLLWGMVEAIMTLISGLIEALTKGILQFSLISNPVVTEAFNAMVVLALVIIVPKVIFEILTTLIKNDDIDLGKTLTHLGLAVVMILSLQTIIPIVNNTFNASMEALTVGSGINIGDQVIENVLIAFGGMPQNGEAGAKELIEQWKSGNLNITERNSDGTYRWQFSEIIAFIGLLIFVGLIFAINCQIAFRSFLLIFYYIFGPIFCLNMTNYKSQQIITVWRNSIFSIFITNLAQMMLLVLLAQLLGSIASFTAGGLGGAPLIYCKISLYIGSFLMVFAVPPVISSALGGYTGSLLDTVRQIQGGIAMGKGATIGAAAAVSGGIANTFGRSNPTTGHRSGGLRGAVFGNKDAQGGRYGGIPGAIMGSKNGKTGDHTGGLRGAIVGDKSKRTDADGSQQETRSGGLRGGLMGTTQSQKGADGTLQKSRSGGLRGGLMGSSQTKHSPDGSVQKTQTGGLRGMLTGTTTQTTTPEGETTISKQGGLLGKLSDSSSTPAQETGTTPKQSGLSTSRIGRTGIQRSTPSVPRNGNVTVDKEGGMHDSTPKPTSISPVKRDIRGKG